MINLKRLLPSILLLASLALTSCGGSNAGTNSSVNDPLLSSGNNGTISGAGAITFETVKTSTDPDGTLISLSYTVPSSYAGTYWTFPQLLPFKVTDSNGKPRVGVSVTLSQSSNLNNLATSNVLPQTVTTDSTGAAIFNVGVRMQAPLAPGVPSIDTIVYQAVTNEPDPLMTYGSFEVTMYTSMSTMTVAPASQAFAATDIAGATRTFTVFGGDGSYNAASSNSSLVTASITGTTLTATLVDDSTPAWTDTVTLTVTDGSGHSATATITRQ